MRVSLKLILVIGCLTAMVIVPCMGKEPLSVDPVGEVDTYETEFLPEPCFEINNPVISGKRVVPLELKDCVEKHSGCRCCLCDDSEYNFVYYVYYPTTDEDFPKEYVSKILGFPKTRTEVKNRSIVLLDVAVAIYECDECECSEIWKFKVDGKWVYFNNPVDFCQHLTKYNKKCGGCLVTWEGGKVLLNGPRSK